eukprot:gene216-4045_t
MDLSRGLQSTVALAGTGHEMPVFGLGTWLSDEGKVQVAAEEAIQQGYRHIDEAWVYKGEEVGAALRNKIADKTVERKDMWITSKLWNNFHRPENVRKGCEESMKKLGVDYLDLYMIHFPVSFQPGVTEATCAAEMDSVPLADTWRAMEALVDAGLVRNIGVSNFEIEHLKEVQTVAKKPIAVNQFETQPYYQRRELVDYCARHGIVVTAHTSL